MANWLQLTSGGGYDFDTKTLFGPYDIDADLAWPLAGEARYVRHTTVTWTVAIHSVAVALCIEAMVLARGGSANEARSAAAAGLLHDAHESVMGDIPTPVSRAIDHAKVEAIKEDIQLAIEQTLAVPLASTPKRNLQLVKLGDAAALHVEKKLFTVPEPRDWGAPPPPAPWMQKMYSIITTLAASEDMLDGGRQRFLSEYERLVPELSF